MPQPHTQTSTQLPLPLYEHAVFFDWYGTLSTNRFWETITDSATHPLGPRLRPAVTDLFTRQSDVIAAWMRGHTTDQDVCDNLGIELPKQYRADFLHRALLDDCRAATVDPALLDMAVALRSYAYIAVASDNMACFAEAPPAILHHGLKIDDLLVSSEIGVLKAEDPHTFFGPFLTQRQLTFKNALLIDDCPKTCAIFRDLGGTAIDYHNPDDLRQALSTWAPSPRLREQFT